MLNGPYGLDQTASPSDYGRLPNNSHDGVENADKPVVVGMVVGAAAIVVVTVVVLCWTTVFVTVTNLVEPQPADAGPPTVARIASAACRT